MNTHSNNTNSLLVEIMIAVLFFALCATVLLWAFTSAYQESELSGLKTSAMSEARDLIEQLSASDNMADELNGNGYTLQEDGSWQKSEEAYVMTVTTESHKTLVGTMEKATVTATQTQENQNAETLLTLKTAAYHPQEVE